MARLGGPALAAVAAIWLAAGPWRASAQEEHVRGVVGAVSGDEVTVKGPDGRPQKLRLGQGTKVNVATRADLAAIGKDAFVGVTAVPAKDGTLRALEVHVFPEAMRGTGEGHRPWDLEPGSTMTNANVAGVDASAGGGSTMTNANVSAVAGEGGAKKLTLSYKDGQQTVLVAPGTPVVRVEPADRAALAPGQHVFAAGKKGADGTMAVDRMFVGKDGVVPPM